MRLKVWVNYIFFIFITIVIATVLSEKTVELNSENAGIRAFYKEPKNQIDAVIIGPSSAYTAFLPPIAYNKYGITTSMYSISGMITEQYIYVVKEVMKYQTPKVIFIVADGIAPLLNRTLSPDNLVALKPLSVVRPSINKIKMIHALKKVFKFTNVKILEYYFPIIRFHSRWKKVNKNIFVVSNPHKGAVIDFVEFHKRIFNIDEYNNKQGQVQQIKANRKQKDPNLYIRDLIEDFRCENGEINKENKEKEITLLEYEKNVENLFSYLLTLKNTKVILLATPTLLTDEYLDRLQYVFHRAKQYGLESFDLGNCDGLNIDLNNDFLDERHLNFKGAYKVTDYLSNILVTKYGLKDKRNDNMHNSWDEEYEYYRNEIKRRYNIDTGTGELINSATNN